MSPKKTPRDWKLRIQDILECIDYIDSFIKDYTLESFSNDKKTFHAVLRNLEVIGEASHHVPAKVKQTHKDIPWREIKDFRNFLAHVYFGADAKIIWDTIHNNLFPLRKKLAAILKE